VAFRAQLDDFAGLYERTYQALYRTALGVCGDASLAADVTQDAYLAAYRQRASFRGDVPVEAWLHRIAVNAALSALRHRRVRWVEPFDPLRHDRSARAAESDRIVDIERALARLDPRSRAAVVLRYFHDLDYATIATILGTSVGNVGSILSRSLDRMEAELTDGEPGAGLAVVREEAEHGR
jgi:RNA polymerase sigma-70 factor, ECF subfamily